MSNHKCGEWCICPIDNMPLIFWPSGNKHACSDWDCVYAQGIPEGQWLAEMDFRMNNYD